MCEFVFNATCTVESHSLDLMPRVQLEVIVWWHTHLLWSLKVGRCALCTLNITAFIDHKIGRRSSRHVLKLCRHCSTTLYLVLFKITCFRCLIAVFRDSARNTATRGSSVARTTMDIRWRWRWNTLWTTWATTAMTVPSIYSTAALERLVKTLLYMLISTTNLAACVCVFPKLDQFLPVRSHFDTKRPVHFFHTATFPSPTFGPLFAFHCPLFFLRKTII